MTYHNWMNLVLTSLWCESGGCLSTALTQTFTISSQGWILLIACLWTRMGGSQGRPLWYSQAPCRYPLHCSGTTKTWGIDTWRYLLATRVNTTRLLLLRWAFLFFHILARCLHVYFLCQVCYFTLVVQTSLWVFVGYWLTYLLFCRLLWIICLLFFVVIGNNIYLIHILQVFHSKKIYFTGYE